MRRYVIACACVVAGSGCTNEPSMEFRSIDPVCVESQADVQGWKCPDALHVDCNQQPVPDKIYVVLGKNQCGTVDLATIPGTFGPGTYDVAVHDDNANATVCTATLEVVDPVPPKVTTTTVTLWPPNHKMNTVTLDECIATVDDCDPNWTATVDWVTSDEPDDANGDGHTSGDVAFSAADAVDLRAERQGGGNGRVYTIGFTVTDGSGNATATTCTVDVPHDQGHHPAIDDGEAYKVDAP